MDIETKITEAKYVHMCTNYVVNFSPLDCVSNMYISFVIISIGI